MTATQNKLPPIILCVIMDIVGYASFSIPGLGEFSDIVWAPLSGFIFYKLFGGKMGKFGGAFGFLEELLPFTDFIPTFTIAWFIKQRAMEKNRSRQVITIK